MFLRFTVGRSVQKLIAANVIFASLSLNDNYTMRIAAIEFVFGFCCFDFVFWHPTLLIFFMCFVYQLLSI